MSTVDLKKLTKKRQKSLASARRTSQGFPDAAAADAVADATAATAGTGEGEV